jgi:hypothetical protein
MGSEPEGGNLKTDTLPPSLPELKIEDTFQIRRDFYRAQTPTLSQNPAALYVDRNASHVFS